MKKSLFSAIALAVLSLTAAQAFAQPGQAEFQDATSFVGSKTRAEAKAELNQARKDGTYNQREWEYPVLQAPAAASKSRAEVTAEQAKAQVAARGLLIDATTL